MQPATTSQPPTERPTYTWHAERVMEVQRVSEEEVEQVLQSYDFTETTSSGNVKYTGTTETGRRITVVVKKGKTLTHLKIPLLLSQHGI